MPDDKVTNQRERPPLEAEFQTLHEFVKAAKMKLSPMIWDYLVGATETETTMRRNRLAIDSVALRPRVLRDVSKIDSGKTFMGKRRRLPLLLSPVGSLESFDPGGGATVAKAAAEFGVPIMLSSVTKMDMEQIKEVPGGTHIYQLYVRGDQAWVDARVDRAIDAGYDAFAVTVDTAVYSRRERDIAKRFAKPWRAAVSGMEQVYQAAYSWKNVEHFKKKYKIPLVLKGIGTAEDAKMAVEHGVDMIYVSNHGGRQLDHGRGSFDVLAEVLEVVNKKAVVIVDGTISFRNLSTGLDLTNNWRGTQLTNLAFAGNNTLRLNNSIATNTLAGGYTFNTGHSASRQICPNSAGTSATTSERSRCSQPTRAPSIVACIARPGDSNEMPSANRIRGE